MSLVWAFRRRLPLRVSWRPRDPFDPFRWWRGLELTARVTGFSQPVHAPHRLYAHCADGSVWRVLVFGRLGLALRVATG